MKKPVKNQLKPIMPVVMIATAVSLITMGVFYTTGLITAVPFTVIPIVQWTLPPVRVVFVSSLIAGLALGLLFLAYYSNRERIHAAWRQFSTWAKSIIIGTITTIITLVVSSLALYLNWITAATASILLLIIWPLSTGTVLLNYRRSDRSGGFGASIKTAYVLTRGLESRTLSAIIALLTAIAVGLAVHTVIRWYGFNWPLWATVLIAGMVCLVVILFTYNQFDRHRVERMDMRILDIQLPKSQEQTEIKIKNTANRSIDLTEALIQDTELELYRPGSHHTLKPGQCATFEIQDSFSLEPNDAAIELPLGYDLKRGGKTPVVFTTDGEIHYLQWTSRPAEKIDRKGSSHLTESVNNCSSESNERNSISSSAGQPQPQD